MDVRGERFRAKEVECFWAAASLLHELLRTCGPAETIHECMDDIGLIERNTDQRPLRIAAKRLLAEAEEQLSVAV